MIVPANLTQVNATVFVASIERYDVDDPDDIEEYFNFIWNVTEFT